jgi:hypothetical protein
VFPSREVAGCALASVWGPEHRGGVPVFLDGAQGGPARATGRTSGFSQGTSMGRSMHPGVLPHQSRATTPCTLTCLGGAVGWGRGYPEVPSRYPEVPSRYLRGTPRSRSCRGVGPRRGLLLLLHRRLRLARDCTVVRRDTADRGSDLVNGLGRVPSIFFRNSEGRSALTCQPPQMKSSIGKNPCPAP